MKVSKKWLQTHFLQELPSTGEIVDALLVHSFEIEGVEEKSGDSIIEIDVLPNRAHDALSHKGIARELSVILSLPLREDRYSPVDFKKEKDTFLLRDFSKGKCFRYFAKVFKNIELKKSPDWIQTRLESIGQRPINNLVDITNYILFDLGQPIHVFDADKIDGGIYVRFAKNGEQMETLDGKLLSLTEEDLVIADDTSVLALAGVKGGRKAEIDENTKNIVIEIANFDPLSVRKSSRRHKIFTDASKRYENGITSELVWNASQAVDALIREVASSEDTILLENNHGFPFFEFYSHPEVKRQIELRLEKVNRILGTHFKEEEIKDILTKLNFSYLSRGNGKYDVVIPFERLDLKIEEDLIEEIGRIFGYHYIPSKKLDEISFSGKRNFLFEKEQFFRNLFIQLGFDEIMNTNFIKKGDVRVLNPVNPERKFLRNELLDQIIDSLEKNLRFSDFLQKRRIRIFEIDRVYGKDGKEDIVLSFAIKNAGKLEKKKFGTEEAQKEEVKEIIKGKCGQKIIFLERGNAVQFSISSCVLKEKIQENSLFDIQSYSEKSSFSQISQFPFIKRDVSFWLTGNSCKPSECIEMIKNLSIPNLQKIYLTDEFQRDDDLSYTFSLIFQSFNKTLRDEEVNVLMEKIYSFLSSKGFRIR